MRTLLLLLAALGLSLPTGCAVVDGAREAASATAKALTPNSRGYRDSTDEADDDWNFVGEDANGLRPMERGGDPLLSAKARSIERNLGVE